MENRFVFFKCVRPALARLRQADHRRKCPLTAAKQTTFARSEFFAFLAGTDSRPLFVSQRWVMAPVVQVTGKSGDVG
jgi:hypothetical protein